MASSAIRRLIERLDNAAAHAVLGTVTVGCPEADCPATVRYTPRATPTETQRHLNDFISDHAQHATQS